MPGAGQPFDAVIVFVSRVTAPVRASSRPGTVAPVVAVTDCCARTVPWNWAPVPTVAELPTCQKTLHELAPPVIMIWVADPMVRVDAAWNTHTEFGAAGQGQRAVVRQGEGAAGVHAAVRARGRSAR